MTARWFFGAALLVGLATPAVNADEPPARIFHIGIVSAVPRTQPDRVAFEDRLRELGYVEGRNLTIDFVHDDDMDRRAEAIGEIARRGVDLIVVGGRDAELKAAITTARSTPVVFTAIETDPLAKGYIAGLAHPGGNATGVVFSSFELIAKRLDLLTQAVPHIARIVLLYDAEGEGQREAATRAASALGVPLAAIQLRNPPYALSAGQPPQRSARRRARSRSGS
jgi:putative ABC transport system substrate-binding protein